MQLRKTVLLVTMFLTIQLHAQTSYKRWSEIIRKSDASWFASAEAKRIAENVLLYQRDIGGWPKNIQMQEELTEKQKKDLTALKKTAVETTTDNGATCQEMLFMSKMYAQVKDERYKESFLKGLNSKCRQNPVGFTG